MNTLDPKTTRRWIIRAALAVLYMTAATILFVTGKGHTILVDNKDDPAGTYSALRGAVVSIDRAKPMEFFPRDRDKFIVKGQKHKIKVKLIGGQEEKTFEFRVPLAEDMTLLSLPKMMSGMEPWSEIFIAPTAAERAADRAADDLENPIQIFGNSGP